MSAVLVLKNILFPTSFFFCASPFHSRNFKSPWEKTPKILLLIFVKIQTITLSCTASITLPRADVSRTHAGIVIISWVNVLFTQKPRKKRHQLRKNSFLSLILNHFCACLSQLYEDKCVLFTSSIIFRKQWIHTGAGGAVEMETALHWTFWAHFTNTLPPWCWYNTAASRPFSICGVAATLRTVLNDLLHLKHIQQIITENLLYTRHCFVYL